MDHEAITLLDLALFRGAGPDANGDISMGAIEAVGLPFIAAGCGRCEATIFPVNASPSWSGYLKCSSGCIGDDGFVSCAEANLALFPEEYTWSGPGSRDADESE